MINTTNTIIQFLYTHTYIHTYITTHSPQKEMGNSISSRSNLDSRLDQLDRMHSRQRRSLLNDSRKKGRLRLAKIRREAEATRRQTSI